MTFDEIFAIPILSNILLYAPLHDFSALINQAAYDLLRNALMSDAEGHERIAPVLAILREEPALKPLKREGELKEPLFLGILPTRGCDMGCRYCDFLTSENAPMPLAVAKNAVDAYLNLISDHGIDHGAIHFFGGEPFFAPDVVTFTVEYARLNAASRGMDIHFEVVTNGLYPKDTAEWIAQNIDAVVLSFDGLSAAQNTHRPIRGGKPSFETVLQNAKIFSTGSCDFVIRSCVSQSNLETLPDWADFILKNLNPSAVCFEPMIETAIAKSNHLSAPDPKGFVRGFVAASDVLARGSVPAIYSTAEIHSLKTSPCPLGQDALIVTPEGVVNACYQIEQQWQDAGWDFQLGRVTGDGFEISAGKIAAMRENHVDEKTLCSGCFCRYHCAGGCPIVHPTDRSRGSYDKYCAQTRMITAASILSALDQMDLRDCWLAEDQSFRRISALEDDRLVYGMRIL